MLLVLTIVCAAVAAWLFVALYEVGHRETLPAWADTYGGMEFGVSIAIACAVFAILFPVQHFLDAARAPLGATEALLSLGAGGLGILAVAWQTVRVRRRMRQLRNVVPLVAADLTMTKQTPAVAANRNAPHDDPRPQHPSGGRARRVA